MGDAFSGWRRLPPASGDSAWSIEETWWHRWMGRRTFTLFKEGVCLSEGEWAETCTLYWSEVVNVKGKLTSNSLCC